MIAGPGAALKTSRTGSALPPIDERVDLAARACPAGDRRADFEHVRAEDRSLAGPEMVGVVLHEGRAALEPRRHDLHGPHESRGLPVALGAEAVAVGHEALDGEAGQLASAR